MAMKRITKELKDVSTATVDGVSAGPNGDDLFNWTATLTDLPEGTGYEGGTFMVSITFPSDYPFKPPKLKFITKMYHCNVNDKGEVCLDILKDNWSPALTILKVLDTLRSLLKEPNADDPLNNEAAELYKKDKKKYVSTALSNTKKYAT